MAPPLNPTTATYDGPRPVSLHLEAAAPAQLGGLSGDTALIQENETMYRYENALTSYLANRFEYLGGLAHNTCVNILIHSPSIFLASGIALAVQYFGPQFHPMVSASSEAGIKGAVSVAKFVGLAFLFKAALEPFLETITEEEPYRPTLKEKIHLQTIRHLSPMALAIIVAYAKGLPVNTVKGTLHTVGIFALIKALNCGLDKAFAWYNLRRPSPKTQVSAFSESVR